MTDDEMRSSSLSRREGEVGVVGDVIGEGLKYDGAAGSVDGVEAESNGGGEIDIAEAMECDMSDRRREARFWLLEKLCLSEGWSLVEENKNRERHTLIHAVILPIFFLRCLPMKRRQEGMWRPQPDPGWMT
jgi:hypothetical protein